MDKADWYFLISTILALIALIGIDWKSVNSRLPMIDKKMPQWLVLSLVIASLAMSGVGWYQSHHVDNTHFVNHTKEIVYGKTFRNETVAIDGKSFQKCTFINVKLDFEGNAPFDIVDCSIDGVWLHTKSDSVASSWYLIKKLGFIKDDVPFELITPSGATEPIQSITKQP